MRLASFSVNNYRSITTARKIQTNNLTVLLGKNNEGKSNILRALNLAMEIIKAYAADPRELKFPSTRNIRGRYNWERDYPISLQARYPNGFSSIELSFDLSSEDISTIRSMTGIRLSGSIPIRVSVNHSVIMLDIPKRGTQAFSNVTNRKKIIEYICFKIDFLFVPAIRTEEESRNVIDAMIENQLTVLEDTREYKEAASIINLLHQQMLDRIANYLIEPLQAFLPSIRDVKIRLLKDRNPTTLRRSDIEIIIDDGKPTPIQQKGDGIKSLVALAMLNNTSRRGCMSVVAIEEPESHLHPGSARQLYETIIALIPDHQVVLTTHSPIFINRINMGDNIIVDSGKATPAKRIKEIRDILGIRVSDNLVNAEIVLIVEGETDRVILQKILPTMSPTIKKAILDGRLIIDETRGTGNLSNKLSFYRNLQCKCYVMLDNDDAGRKAGQKATEDRLIETNHITYTICQGSSDSEIEDCLCVSAYSQAIKESFGVSTDCTELRGNNKWSDRMEKCFRAQGKQWDDTIEKKVKQSIAETIPADSSISLNKHKRSSIDALVVAIEEMIHK